MLLCINFMVGGDAVGNLPPALLWGLCTTALAVRMEGDGWERCATMGTSVGLFQTKSDNTTHFRITQVHKERFQ